MRTPATITALIAILTTSAALAQGLAPPPTRVGRSGQAYAEIQLTNPMPFPPFQVVLSPVAASVAPHAGAGPMTGQRGGPGAMGSPWEGMKGRPHDGMKGHGQGNRSWRDHARENHGDFRHFPYGHRPREYMNQYPDSGYYNPYGGYSNPNYGYSYSPSYGYNYYPYSYYPYYGYNSWPNFFGYNYWNPAYYYNPGYGY
jgi:hypothetical protein